MFMERTTFSTLIIGAVLSASVSARTIEATLEAIEAEITARESAENASSESSVAVSARQAKAEAAKEDLNARMALDEAALQAVRDSIAGHVTTLANDAVSADETPETPETIIENPLAPVVPSQKLLDEKDIVGADTDSVNLKSIIGHGAVTETNATFATDGFSAPLAGEVEGMMRRVLTRPEAMLRDGAGGETPLDTFSILYVYDNRTDANGTRWLAVGTRADRVDGWVRHDATEDWKTMLVMEYSPRTNARRPVLFFSTKEHLKEVIEDPSGHAETESIFSEVAKGSNAGGRIVTVEPSRSVGRSEMYLMPILDFNASYFAYGDYADVMMLELAGLTGESSSRNDAATAITENETTPGTSDVLKDFRLGIAFVIDTTRSMGPYINATKDFVRNVYNRLAQRGLLDRFRFGLVGYRDNVEAAPGAGYVTRVYSSLDAPNSIDELLSEIDAVLPATAATEDWREDAFAGLRSAVYDLDWDNVDAKFVVLVTDASARAETDHRAKYDSFGAVSVRAIMDQNDIVVYVLHLRTEEARRTAGDGEIHRAQAQYQTLGRYLPVEGNTARVFSRALEGVENILVETLADFAEGRELEDGVNAADNYKVIDILLGREVLKEDNAELAAKPIASDIFRYQQAYLGNYEGVKPPKFYRAWAADRDLLSQNQESLTVSVLVSRGQLELLADTLERTIADVDAKSVNLSEFHSGTRDEAGKTAVDPQLSTVAAEFLEVLPYKSKFLQLSGEGFRGLGQGQEDLLNEVRAKLSGYHEILSSDKRWMRVSEASEEELYPLPLRDLP